MIFWKLNLILLKLKNVTITIRHITQKSTQKHVFLLSVFSVTVYIQTNHYVKVVFLNMW